MTESECLEKMIAPAGHRPCKPYRGGVIQIWVTRACDKACFGCTQGSNLVNNPGLSNYAKTRQADAHDPFPPYITPEQFAQAVESLRGYFGVVGVFGGNPAMHPQFVELCRILRESWVPQEQRGLWCNNPLTVEKAKAMRATFHPGVSNLNVHLDATAHALFTEHWPESRPFGKSQDSRHSPPFVAMKDVLKKDCASCGGTGKWDATAKEDPYTECPDCRGAGKVYDEALAWELISGCDINRGWSALIGVFRGQLRAWFCEIAGAQAMLHQHEPDYPDTGLDPTRHYNPNGLPTAVDPGGPVGLPWWALKMPAFAGQVRKHCHDCGVPLRGYGELAQARQGVEQVSEAHKGVYFPKRRDRPVQAVTERAALGTGRLGPSGVIDYLGNAKR